MSPDFTYLPALLHIYFFMFKLDAHAPQYWAWRNMLLLLGCLLSWGHKAMLLLTCLATSSYIWEFHTCKWMATPPKYLQLIPLSPVWWRTCVLFQTWHCTDNPVFQQRCNVFGRNISGMSVVGFFPHWLPSFVMVGIPHHLFTDKDQIDLWETGMQRAEKADGEQSCQLPSWFDLYS